ncbi:MAG TPA: zinc dependent phospholipase C family protein [Vicinamibacterales bacterium]|nr:zinc dependent phospholipase C family protein [Vicinamibacterales bacterium]
MLRRLALIVILMWIAPGRAAGYSVLAHEATIDVNWESTIAPLLRQRFPGVTADALMQARSYAYGGSVIQDLGYYPFGSRFFSNLLHYVRSGDFVTALLRDAATVDEYAFAIGALAHYANDNTGHPEAVNRSVPLAFPKLRLEHGNTVTYVDAPAQHVIVEFSFDVVQAAGGAYLPDAYQRLIGFRVATPLLERAFLEVYGLEMKDVFLDMDRSIATYRYSVSQIIPALTEAAWRDKREEIVALHPQLQRSGFVFAFGRDAFEREYGRDYQRPGWFARLLGFIYRILPKIGPLKPLSFKTPSAEAEALFTKSFRDASARLREELRDMRNPRGQLPNTNLDTGKAARHGDYSLADDTHGELVERLVGQQFSHADGPLRQTLLAYYGPDPRPSADNRKERKHWQRVGRGLEAMRLAADAGRREPATR